MNYHDCGSWGPATRYEDPEAGYAFARYTNELGEDWYETVAHREDRPKGVALGLAPDGTVLFRADDVVHMEPGNKRVVVLLGVTEIANDQLFPRRFNLDTGELEDLPQPTPRAVSKRQLKMWLVMNGYSITAVEDQINTLPEPDRTLAFIEWQDASEYALDHPTLLMVAQALGITDIEQAAKEAVLI